MNCELILTLKTEDELVLSLDGENNIDLTLETATPSYPVYEGETEFTPSQETQVVLTGGKILLDNITVNPIPSNYGLVTYHANIITIS